MGAEPADLPQMDRDWRSSLRRCALICDPHRVPELGPVHDVRCKRGFALERPAQLAQDRPRVVRVHALPDQRGSTTTPAAFAPGRELIDTAPQKGELEVEPFADRTAHVREFGASRAVPPNGAPAGSISDRRPILGSAGCFAP